MRNDNGRWLLDWESATTRLSRGYDYPYEALEHATTLQDEEGILNIVLWDREADTFSILKGRMFAGARRAIPVGGEVGLTRREMLVLEMVLVALAKGLPTDFGEEETVAGVLAKVEFARARLEEAQERQRRINAACGDRGEDYR
jgi:hypothetical protein